MFLRRLRGYRAAFRVETHRKAAEQLRREEPEMYEQILGMAEGQRKPRLRHLDAFVALLGSARGRRSRGLTALI